MVLLLILELAAGISGYVLRDDIDRLVDENMTELQKEYNSSTSTQQLFDNMQENVSTLPACKTFFRPNKKKHV